MKTDPGRRFALAIAAAWAAGALPASPALAQPAYPDRPVRLVVPFAPGGTSDLVARIVAKKAGEKLGQPIVIDNRGGAGGNLGAAMVAGAAPDGYTLLMGSSGNIAINPSLYRQLPYDPVKSFEPIAMLALAPHVAVVSTTSPIRTVADLIAYGKQRSNDLTFASGGVGTPTHLAGEMFAQRAGLPMRHIPYKGSSQALADLMGGQVVVVFDSLPAALGLVRGGKLRAIAQTGDKRVPQLPDVPTLEESGLRGLQVIGWFGLMAPAGTPAPIVQKLGAAVEAALADPEVKAQLSEQGATAGSGSPAEFARFIAADIERWAAVVKSAGIQPE